MYLVYLRSAHSKTSKPACVMVKTENDLPNKDNKRNLSVTLTQKTSKDRVTLFGSGKSVEPHYSPLTVRQAHSSGQTVLYSDDLPTGN
jgi:hypothetical protein